MKISLNFIGVTIVELLCETYNIKLEEDIADVNGYVNIEFIDELKDIVQELERHNEELFK